MPHETDRIDKNQDIPILVTGGGKIYLFYAHDGNMYPDLQSTTEEILPLLYRWSDVDSQVYIYIDIPANRITNYDRQPIFQQITESILRSYLAYPTLTANLHCGTNSSQNISMK
ncbi:hypothetical protein BJX99DRAFT_55572 [Aspergillus californicus]